MDCFKQHEDALPAAALDRPGTKENSALRFWLDRSSAVLGLLSNPSKSVLVSAASVWELNLKHHQGKLPELSGAITDLPGLLQADDEDEEAQQLEQQAARLLQAAQQLQQAQRERPSQHVCG